jgi:hypothetical protein
MRHDAPSVASGYDSKYLKAGILPNVGRCISGLLSARDLNSDGRAPGEKSAKNCDQRGGTGVLIG